MNQNSVYYNEFDSHSTQWTRNLIDAGLISPGFIDRRDIRHVSPNGLCRYSRCHFFAGISGWDLALRLAGWPDDRPVWTGSCPCQPYSSAGKGLGNDDPRNLWPEFFRLIRKCRPDTIFGEQVESAIGHGWLDGISRDLEGEGYAVGSIVLGAHSVGSPNIRQRLYWVAYAGSKRLDRGASFERSGRDETERRETIDNARDDRESCGLGHPFEPGREGFRPGPGSQPRHGGDGGPTAPASPWSNFDLIACRDGKKRRVESGSFPLVARVPFRLADGRTGEGVSRAACLKGIGNAIVPWLAAEFIREADGWLR